MNTKFEHHPIHDKVADKLWFKEIAPVLFLIDVVLMFSSMVINQVASIWVYAIFQIVVTSYAAFVIYLASRAAKVIRPSMPFQRPTGVLLFASAHFLQFVFPGQLPIALAGYVMLAVPISILFLFAE